MLSDTQPMTKILADSTESRTQRAMRVEGELRELQDKHRLAIHMWEDGVGGLASKTEMPDYSLSALKAVEAKDIRAQLAKREMPLSSLSLLPSQATGKTMLPYAANPDYLCTGYLLTLDQSESSPALVTRAYPNIIGSGNAHYSKDGNIRAPNNIESLDDFYTKFEDQDELQQVIATDKGKEYSALQLDGLAQSFKWFGGSENVRCNEVLAAASLSHVKAIVIPLRLCLQNKATFTNLVNVYGAIAGLKHLENGIDLPVTSYHVTGEQRGEVTYIGQGKDELREVLLESLAEYVQAVTCDPDMQTREVSKTRDNRTGLKLSVACRINDMEKAATKVLGEDVKALLAGPQKNVGEVLL